MNMVGYQAVLPAEAILWYLFVTMHMHHAYNLAYVQ